MERADITIIGAGVIGLAIAARLAIPTRTLIVLEQHASFGQETSSRNSEVIHSGLYYPATFLKTKLCVAGNPMLYNFCATHAIPVRKTGKLLVATTPAERAQLEGLWQNGQTNQIPGLQWLDKNQVLAREPLIRCQAALFSPSTGIFNTHLFMARLAHLATSQAALLLFNARVKTLAKIPVENGFRLEIEGQAETLQSELVINCAGLGASKIAQLAGIDLAAAGYQQYLCKGDYFRLRKKLAIHHLVYPVPDHTGKSLGIHLTQDLNGSIRFGPDAEYITTPDYSIRAEKRQLFSQAISAYLPDIKAADLEPDTSGIRPKLQGPGDGLRDFVIRHEADRGLTGLINLIGIESPGLTSTLAIAEYVADMVKEII